MIKIDRRGATRIVILTQKWAIKIPSFVEWRLFLFGLLANMQEVKFSRSHDFKDILCPVVFSIPGGFLLIMPRVEVVDEISYDELYPFVKRLPFLEVKACNYGYLREVLVCVDYGN
jgi:hypothetical protein